MDRTTLAGIGAAVLTAAFVAYFASDYGKDEPLAQAPESIIPIGGVGATTPFPLPLLPTSADNPFIGPLIMPGYRVSEGTATDTSPAAAAAIGTTKTKEEPAPEPKPAAANDREALTANTLSLQNKVVNILCASRDGSLPPMSGTGIIIDERGLVLTVAHVAQYLLLKDYPTEGNVTCALRVGSPAKTAYAVKLLYLSPDWIRANPATLVTKNPTGTGRYDFAVLGITETLPGNPEPGNLAAVSFSDKTPEKGQRVGIGSYGAQYLDSAQVRTALYPIIVFGSIEDRFTFDTNTVDVIRVAGNAAAQHGSSGGAVVNSAGELLGLITTSMTSGDIATRRLQAITPRHIREAFENDTGEDFDAYFAGSFDALAEKFAARAQTLGSTLLSYF